MNYSILPIVFFVAHLVTIFSASTLPTFSEHQSSISLGLLLVLVLQTCLYIFGQMSLPEQKPNKPDLLSLLKAPDFPHLPDCCAYCLVIPGPDELHCQKCQTCQPRWHYHETVCVNKSNEIFWLLVEITWFWLAYTMHEVLFSNLEVKYLNVLTFSDSIFFRNAAVVDHLV